jgi:hypothetical protein
MQWNLHKENVYRTVGNGEGNRQGHGRIGNVWYGSFHLNVSIARHDFQMADDSFNI